MYFKLFVKVSLTPLYKKYKSCLDGCEILLLCIRRSFVPLGLSKLDMFTFNHLYIYILYSITCNCAAWRCWKSSAWLLYTLVGHMGSYMGAAQITWRGLPIGDWWELKVSTFSLATSSPTAPHPSNLFLSLSLILLVSVVRNTLSPI